MATDEKFPDGSSSGYAGSHRPVPLRNPPPLPPRQPSMQSLVPPPIPPRQLSMQDDEPPPPYSFHDANVSEPASETWTIDRRGSTVDSISPSERPSERQDGLRTLLLIYIHGFMGNEMSFQGLPSHVHNILTAALAETHVVHTKIYPRYKSRKAIEFARNNFSEW